MKKQQPTNRRHNQPRRTPSRRAFSFVELLIVVMLLGVMAGVAAPKYRSALEATHLEAVAKQLAANFRRAQSEAQQLSTSRSIVLDPAGNSYSSTNLYQLDRPSELLAVSLVSTGFAIQIDSADFGGSPTVTFDHFGIPQTTGSVTLSLNGLSAVVSLNATGLVEVAL